MNSSTFSRSDLLDIVEASELMTLTCVGLLIISRVSISSESSILGRLLVFRSIFGGSEGLGSSILAEIFLGLSQGISTVLVEK